MRRSRARSRELEARAGREKLRLAFEDDPDLYAKVKAVYEGGIEAVTTCPACKDLALPDHRTRLAAGDSFLAQIYGKPKQNVDANHEHTLVVVSRLEQALEQAEHEDDVIEYEELEAGES